MSSNLDSLTRSCRSLFASWGVAPLGSNAGVVGQRAFLVASRMELELEEQYELHSAMIKRSAIFEGEEYPCQNLMKII